MLRQDWVGLRASFARHFAATVLCVDMNPLMQRGLQAATRGRGTGPALPAHPSLAASSYRSPDGSLDGAWSQDAMCHMDKPAVVAEVRAAS